MATVTLADPVDDVVAGYRFELTCPRCAGRLRHVTASPPSPGGGESRAVAVCTRCSGQLVILVRISLTGGRNLRPPKEAS